MDKITVKSAYEMLNQLVINGASINEIANLALDCLNLWNNNNSKDARCIVYDLALLEEEGMELSHCEIFNLIQRLKFYV